MALGLSPVRTIIPPHTHAAPDQGGQLALDAVQPSEMAKLALLSGRTSGQTFDGAITVPGLTSTAAIELADLSTTPIQSAVGAFICLLGAAAVTAGRTWTLPDASGKPVVSGTLVTRTGLTGDDSGTVLAGPDAGLYAFLVYAETTTAGTGGTQSVTLTAVGHGGSCPQVAMSAFNLAAKNAQSALIVCYVASGDVTYATVKSGVTGSPVYDLSIIPLGRIA